MTWQSCCASFKAGWIFLTLKKYIVCLVGKTLKPSQNVKNEIVGRAFFSAWFWSQIVRVSTISNYLWIVSPNRIQIWKIKAFRLRISHFSSIFKNKKIFAFHILHFFCFTIENFSIPKSSKICDYSQIAIIFCDSNNR